MNVNRSFDSLALQVSNRFAILDLLGDEQDGELDSSVSENSQVSSAALKWQSFPGHGQETAASPDHGSHKASDDDISRVRGCDIPSENDSLCAKCQAIFEGPQEVELFEGQEQQHTSEPASFEKAVKAGCYIYSLLAQKLESLAAERELAQGKVIDLGSRVEKKLKLVYEVYHDGYDLCIDFTEREEGPLKGHIILSLVLFDSSVRRESHSNSTTSSTSSEQSMGLVRYWLQQCCNEHKECRNKTIEQKMFPSRLLEVESNEKVRLCNASTLSQSASYLTLSHCWGRQPIFTLLKRNFEELSKHIQTDRLPKVFQDAIRMTRHLGFKYIWIDSLCIIQDSKEDWLQEASRMGEVYKHAACNLAATGFSDGRNGLFATRDGRLTVPLKVHVAWNGIHPNRRAPLRGEYYVVDWGLWKHSVCNAPLNRRAWVVQERILSPRIIHFGAKQLFWECYQLRASEGFPNGLDHKHDRGDNLKRNLYESDPKRSYSYWREVVQAYSKGRLTFSQDKLPAISGIAMEMSKSLCNRYIAGLWEGDLIHMLLWNVCKPSQFIKLPSTYRAPTWSWASIDDEVSYRHAMRNADISLRAEDDPPQVMYSDIVSVNSSLFTGDPTGATVQWSLRVKGPLRRATKMKLPRYEDFVLHWAISWRGWVVNLKEIKIALTLDFVLYADKHVRDLETTPAKHTTKEGAFLRDPNFRLGDSRVDHVFILPIRSDWEGISNYQFEMYGLVLYPTGRSKGEFYRIGSFAVEEQKHQRTVLESLDVLEDCDFEEADGFGQYTITIV